MQKKVQFENRSGHTLAGVLHTPVEGPVRGTALFAHCFTCTKNVLAAVHIADALAAEGFRVLRFDFTGLGDSEGDFADTHFSANVMDLLDAAGWLAQQGHAPELLVGHSLGGTAVLAAAHEIDSALAVATIGSPADAEHVLHLLASDLETIENEGSATVKLGGRPFELRRDFLEDVRAQSVRDRVGSLRRALLVMHAPLDQTVSIDEAARLYTSAKHPKSFISLDQADHLLSRKEDSRYAGQVLACWASRYLPVLEREDEELDSAAPTIEGVQVRGSRDDGFLVNIRAGSHAWLGDEPQTVGGGDLGPTPYDFLGAALGSCTVMTLNFFARRENLPLESATVTVEHDRIHAEDCDHCESKDGKIDRLTRRIELEGPLNEAQHALLVKIADRCPIHKTLENEIVIENELV